MRRPERISRRRLPVSGAAGILYILAGTGTYFATRTIHPPGTPEAPVQNHVQQVRKLVLSRETVRDLTRSGSVPLTGVSNTNCLCSESGCNPSVTICTAQ